MSGTEDKPLYNWYNAIRTACKKIKKGENPNKRLTDDNIQDLMKI